NERRALSLLKGSAYDAQHAKWALGQLTLEGRLVPRDVAAAVKLLGPWSQWDYDTRLQIVRLLAENPDVQMAYPDHFIYRAIEDAELGEPGAMDALIALKLSRHVKFANKANGCVLANARQKTAMTLLRPAWMDAVPNKEAAKPQNFVFALTQCLLLAPIA